MFENYKTKVLLKIMKTIVKVPHIALNKDNEEVQNVEEASFSEHHH